MIEQLHALPGFGGDSTRLLQSAPSQASAEDQSSLQRPRALVAIARQARHCFISPNALIKSGVLHLIFRVVGLSSH